MNLTAAQYRCHRQIAHFGISNAILRRGFPPVDRLCTAGVLAFNTADNQGAMVTDADLRVLVSGYSLLGKDPPDPEQDTLLMNDPNGNLVTYRMVAPPSRLAPDNNIVFYWELLVKK
jgi:hypothetical protein